MRPRFLLITLVLIAGCSIRAPELDASISVQSRQADWPVLVPLGPLLRQSDILSPRSAEDAGRTLEWRAADLRRRAAILRAIRLN